MKMYRVVLASGEAKEFASLPAACRYQDRHGGELQGRYSDGWARM